MSRASLPSALAPILEGLATPAMASLVANAWAQLPSNNREECLSIGSRAAEGLGFHAGISLDRQTIFG